MIRLLDYIYYRFAKAYYKWDSESGITGVMAVALFVSLVLIDILGIIYFNVFSNEFRLENKENAKIIGILLIVGIIFFSLRKYKNKFPHFEKKWGDEERGKKIRNGILIILLLLLPIVIPVIYLNVLN